MLHYSRLLGLALMLCTSFALACHGQSTEPYTWKNVPIGGGGYITGMKIHPVDATKRYYRTDVGGAYRWNEATQRMEQIIYLDDRDLYSVAGIALHPTDTDIVYLAVGRKCETTGTAILKSTNAGQSFTQVNIVGGIPFWFAANGGRDCGGNSDKDRQGTPLEINPHNPNELYIGTRSKGLYILDLTTYELTDVPNSSIPENSNYQSIRSVVFHPTQPRVYVAYAGHGVYVGNVNTQTYTRYGATTNTQLQDAIDISISKDATHLLVACKTQGIMKATNLTGTLSWSLLSGYNAAHDEGYLTVDCSPHDNDVAVTVVADWNHIDEFQVTTDGGATWTEVGGSVAANDNIFPWRYEAFASHVSQIAFDPVSPQTMHYTSWFSTFSCDNFSLTGHNDWHNHRASGHEEIVPTDLVAFPTNTYGQFLMAGSGDHTGFMFDSDIVDPEAYATFHIADHATSNVNPLKKCASIDFCEEQSDNLVVCITEEWHASPAGLLITNDGGVTWDLAAGYDANNYNKSLVAMSSDNPDNIIALNNVSMLYTLDGGDNFHNSSGSSSSNPSCSIPYTVNCLGATNVTGNNINDNVFGPCRNITADKNVDCVFYFYNWDGTFNISTDGGQNWCIVNNSLPVTTNMWNRTRLISIPGANHQGQLWININEDLYHSTDAGATWVNCTTSPQYNVNKVKALSFGKGVSSAYEAIYIFGSIDGVSGDLFYRSDDNGLSWININVHAENEVWGDNKIIAGDRNVAGRLYATASGQGVLYGDTDNTPPPSCDNAEKTISGEFSDINNPNIPDWTVSEINGATMDGSINPYDKAVLDISSPGTNNFDLQLWQDDLTMEDNKVYLIQVDLRADNTRSVTVKLRNKSNGTTYLERDVTVTSDSKEYAFLIKPNVIDNDLRLTVMVGGNAATVYIDHVRFKEYCDGDITELACLDFITLNDLDILPELYHAKSDINSNGKVLSGQVVDFHAGNTVLLEAGFEIESGVTFTAQIVGCP